MNNRKPTRKNRWSTNLCAFALAAGFAAMPTQALDWARFDGSCAGIASQVSFECGAMGTYRVGNIQNPNGCVPAASGNEVQLGYAAQFLLNGNAFPVAPTFGMGGVPGGDSNGLWVSVLDFDAGTHGWSTTNMTAEVAGSSITALLNPLDHPSLDPLGDAVTDVHVLAGLCRVLDAIDNDSAPPLGINMSFGRLLEGPQPQAGCQDSVVCQVAAALHELRHEHDVTLTAAAGNHDALLFPASLEDVLAIGMMDLHSLFTTGIPAAISEAPNDLRGLAPGSNLCLEQTFAAPSGSSYSSALLAGWFAQMRLHLPADPHDYLDWRPAYSEVVGRWVLTNGTQSFSQYNQGVERIFGDYLSDGLAHCWGDDPATSVFTSDESLVVDPLEIESFAEWSALEISPTPEGDPCVPCTGTLGGTGSSGSGGGGSGTLTLNMSQSEPLASGVHVEAVYISTAGGLLSISLSPAALVDIADGNLDELTLTGIGVQPPLSYQPSLWFELGNTPDCAQTGTCYWTSTPILILNNN